MLYAVRGGQRLAPAAKLTVQRTSHRLLDAEGQQVAWVHDHRHTVVDPRGELDDESWSVITVESNGAAPKGFHKKLSKSVRAGGASRADEARTRPRGWPESGRPTHKRLAGLVDDYAQVQLANLALADLGLRRGDDTVHEARLAIRRLRTTLEVFGDVFDDDWSRHLQAELEWFGDALGRVRDVDIAAARAANPSRPNEFATDETYADLDRIWIEQRNAAVEDLETVLTSRRYQALVLDLDAWRMDPHYTKAGDKGRKTARTYVHAARKDLDRRLRKATRSDADNETMHKARKAAKRLRYAAELATPVLDKPAKLRKEAKYLQRTLGDLQDSRIAVDYLVDAAMKDGPSNTSFTLGWLVAQEQLVADQIRTVLRHSLR
jgi:CHAD domain-containing protein